MTHHILDLPNEIIEMIIMNIISQPWKDDVRDFLALTSTCQRLYSFSHNEKYWQKLALRRDSSNNKSNDIMSWLNYCKKGNLKFEKK